MNLGLEGEVLLRPAAFVAKLPEVPGEALTDIHPSKKARCRRSIYRRSVTIDLTAEAVLALIVTYRRQRTGGLTARKVARMIGMRIGLITASVLLSAEAPVASPTAVFGIEIGQPIHLPECALHRFQNGPTVANLYEQVQQVTCFERDIQLSDAPWRRGWIHFPPGQSPLILHDDMISYFVIDGVVVGLRAETLDHNNTEAIMRQLTARFGRPSSVAADREILQGIAVPSSVATWHLPQLVVTYRNIDSDIGHGALTVMTPAFAQIRDAQDRAEMQARVPL